MSLKEGIMAPEINKNINDPNTIRFCICLKLNLTFSIGVENLSTCISSIQNARTENNIEVTQNPLSMING